MPSRRPVLISVSLLFIASVVNAFQGADTQLFAAKNERTILRNQYGAVIQDSNGQRNNYSRQELGVQELQARSNQASVQSQISEVDASPNVEAAWSYATFGSGIGLSNIIVAQNGANPEIYTGAGFNSYWIALRYNSTTHDYDQVYVSPYFSSSISRIKVANVIGDSAKEIIVAVQDGHIYLYDQTTKVLVSTLTTAANGLTGLDVADVDGDGANELVLCTANHLYVYSGSGTLKWELAGVGGNDLVVAQMDADSALEIAVTDGHVVDCSTHLPQWTWSYGFGSRLAAADIDGDGMKELIVAEGWQYVWAYDVDRQLPKWSISTSQDIGALFVTDIDGDGSPEILVGQGQWGSIIAFDPVTQQQKWAVPNPEHGVTNIAVGDVDGDGASELLWGAGASSSGPDHLYVANWQTKQIKWQNVHLDGPFIGPEIGDLDGDGRPEMVVISWSSDSGYSSGRILVFDAVTRRLRGISGPTMQGGGWTGIHDLRLRDVNGDGKLEILVGAEYTYEGVIEIYSFDRSNNFSLIWTSGALPTYGSSFYSVDAADVDNDGAMEIVGGSGDGLLHIYSYATGTEKWHTLYMRGTVTSVGIADLNGDGTQEIVGMVGSGDVYVFDGPSRQLETILFGPFTSMRVQKVGGIPSIVLGNSSGELMIYRYSAGTYSQTYKQKLITTAVSGFTIDSNDRVWIGSPGAQYNSPGTLTEVTLAGTILATYSGYGSVFGMRTAFVPASLMFFTTGSYSIEAYPSCAASLSSTGASFSPAGGSGSVNVTTDSTCTWAAVSNADWIITKSAATAGGGTLDYSVSSNPGSARTGTITIAGMTFTVTQASFPSPPAYQGFHDGAGCNTISGWAWDPNNPSSLVNVDIYDGTTLIGTSPANMYREDLLNALGSPNHGFSFNTPATLRNGAAHTINVKFSGTNTLLANTGRTVQCSQAPNLFGRHDGQGCNAIEGWAWDSNDRNGTVSVDIYDGSTLLGSVAATLYRQDLADALGSPYHGWIFHPPASLRDGQPHTITVKFGGTNTNLPLDTPRTTTCTSTTPNYQGNLDVADCNFISGFAWDANDGEGTIVVAIYVDGGFFVVVPAQEAYPAVGSGYHGFKFAVPVGLKNGQQHSVQVKFSGTTTDLSNSPKTITCSP